MYKHHVSQELPYCQVNAPEKRQTYDTLWSKLALFFHFFCPDLVPDSDLRFSCHELLIACKLLTSFSVAVYISHVLAWFSKSNKSHFPKQTRVDREKQDPKKEPLERKKEFHQWWTFWLHLKGCRDVEHNSLRHKRMETNGKSPPLSIHTDTFLQLVKERTGKDKHISCSVVLHQIAFISEWTENTVNHSCRGVTSSVQISWGVKLRAEGVLMLKY